VTGFTFADNIVPDNLYGIKGSGTAAGNATITRYYPAAIVRRNIFVGGHSATYPVDNFYPATVAAVGFADVTGDYRLTAASPYDTAATDGTAIGADPSAILNRVPMAP